MRSTPSTAGPVKGRAPARAVIMSRPHVGAVQGGEVLRATPVGPLETIQKRLPGPIPLVVLVKTDPAGELLAPPRTCRGRIRMRSSCNAAASNRCAQVQRSSR